MSLLLDTHPYLGFIDADPRLSPTATQRIADPDARVPVSVINAWDIVIKTGTGKLVLDLPLADIRETSIEDHHFEVLDVTTEHVRELEGLSPYHRDPFDRLLIAQAVADGHQIVSADAAFDPYPVQRNLVAPLLPPAPSLCNIS